MITAYNTNYADFTLLIGRIEGENTQKTMQPWDQKSV